VDGGLSDMYNTSHLLADNEVSIENFESLNFFCPHWLVKKVKSFCCGFDMYLCELDCMPIR